METSASGSADVTFLLLRPIAAVVFTLSLVFVGWFLAWKLVLVHVPLVQEIFGLRKKPIKPKPVGRRKFTQFYNRINGQAFSSSDCHSMRYKIEANNVTMFVKANSTMLSAKENGCAGDRVDAGVATIPFNTR